MSTILLLKRKTKSSRARSNSVEPMDAFACPFRDPFTSNINHARSWSIGLKKSSFCQQRQRTFAKTGREKKIQRIFITEASLWGHLHSAPSKPCKHLSIS